MSDLHDLRHNGSYFETLVEIHAETIPWHEATSAWPVKRPLEPDQREENGLRISEVWVPYLTFKARWRAVMDKDSLAQPPTTEYDELIAEGWAPPSPDGGKLTP